MLLAAELRLAAEKAPRSELASLAHHLWRAHAAGRIGDVDAQDLAELIHARQRIPSVPKERRRVGSRPRSPVSVERRRRWAGSGWLPATLCSHFTAAEQAVLAIVAAQIALSGLCTLAVGAIAGRAGVSESSARNALRQARRLGLVRIEERRQSYARSLPNVVSIVSPEWAAWVKRRGRGGCKSVQPTKQSIFSRKPKWPSTPPGPRASTSLAPSTSASSPRGRRRSPASTCRTSAQTP